METDSASCLAVAVVAVAVVADSLLCEMERNYVILPCMYVHTICLQSTVSSSTPRGPHSPESWGVAAPPGPT